MADQRHQLGRVALVEQRERRVETEAAGVQAEEPVGDGVERPAPHPGGGTRLDPAQHLGGRAAAEGEQADALRRDAVVDERLDPGGEGGRLAGAGAGEDQQRAAPVLDRRPLGRRGEHVFDATAGQAR